MLMLTTDKNWIKIEGDAVTNLSYFSQQSQFLVYGIYHSYK